RQCPEQQVPTRRGVSNKQCETTPRERIMMRVVWLAVLLVGAFAASYFLFREGPGLFQGSRPGDPPGMVWVPGGTFWRGSDNPKMHDAQPAHQVAVDGFWMDQTAVTNEQFARFVEATDYVTVAERTPDAKDFPGAPPENLVAGSVVFTPPKGPVPLDNH